MTTLRPAPARQAPTPGPDSRPSARSRRSALARNATYAGVSLLVLYLVGTPLLYLLWGTFFDADGLSLDSFARAFGDADAGEMVWNSIVFAVGSALLALVVGSALAYLHARTDVPMKGMFFAASMVPLVLPPVVYAPAWVFLFGGEAGALSGPLISVFGASPINAYGMTGMITVEGLHLAPIVFLFMVAAFRSMDSSLEEAARVSGASWFTVIRRISLPLARPAIASATVIVTVLGLESFEIPVMLGEPSGIYVFTSRIYFLTNDYPADLGAAGALSMSLMVVAAVLLLAFGGGRSGGEHQTVTGKAFRPAMLPLGRARNWVGTAVGAYFFLSVIAPVAVLIYVSLSPFYQSPSWEALSLLSLENYTDLFGESDLLAALRNSVLLALVSATVVMLLTTVASVFVKRSTMPGRKILDALALAPLMIPGIVLGLGLSFVYLQIPLPIYGTVVILAIAYVTRFLPYGMRYAGSAMTQIGNELEEASTVGGASWWTMVRRILLPLATPGIVSGWIFVMMISFRELSSTVLLAGPNSEVLSVILFRQFNEGTFGSVAALGVLMATTLLVLILLTNRIGARFGVRVES